MSGPLGSSKPQSGQAPAVSGVFSLAAPAPADGQSCALQVDSAGNLLVNVAVGGGGGGSNASVGTTGAAAPTSATEIGVIDGTGKLQGASATNPVRVDPTGTTTQPVSGTVTANAGTNLNTSALALDATLTGGTQKTKIVDSAGTNLAAVSAAGALKVDGSAVTQPVSGNVNQAIGTAGFEKITDGTNTAAVKAASTAAAATDPSLVVALSPNSPVPTGANTIGSVKVTDGTTVAAVIAGTAALKTDLSSVAGTATGTAAAGVQKVGVVGGTGTSLETTAGVIDHNLKNVNNAAVATAAAGVQLVGIEGRAGTSLETTAGVLDENIKNVGNSAVATAAAGVQKVGIVGNAGATVDSTAAAGAAPTNAVLTSNVFNTTVPAPTAGQAVAQQCDSVGSLLVSSEGRKASYNAAYRLVDATAGQLSLTFTFTANTNKQLATIYHAASATKNVKIHYISITPSTGALGVFDFEVRALSATTAPATGNPAITPGKFAQADAAAEATCLALPTTAGSLVAADSPVSGAFEWNSAAAAAVGNPSGLAGQEIVLFNDQLPGCKPLTMRAATAEGYAVNARSSAAVALRFTIRIVFTEE